MAPEIHDVSQGHGVSGLEIRAENPGCCDPNVATRASRGPNAGTQGSRDLDVGTQVFHDQGVGTQECWDGRLQGVATYYCRELVRKLHIVQGNGDGANDGVIGENLFSGVGVGECWVAW